MRKGLSLLEILAVVTLVGILSAIVLPRLTGHVPAAKKTSCQTHKALIEVQAQLWMRHQGVFPAASLSDIGAAPAYFPEGLPTCPVDGSPYQLNTTTGKVLGHTH